MILGTLGFLIIVKVLDIRNWTVITTMQTGTRILTDVFS